MFSRQKNESTQSADESADGEGLSRNMIVTPRSVGSSFVLDTHKPSVISDGFVFTGDIVARGTLHIEGKVIGNVRCDAVNIGNEGSVDGHIECVSLQVKGSLHGTCTCSELVLASSARVSAKVTYNILTVARGAKTDGEFLVASGSTSV